MGVVERALRNEFPDTASPFAPGFHHVYWRRSPLGYGRPRALLSRLRVNEPKRIVVPLSVDEVALKVMWPFDLSKLQEWNRPRHSKIRMNP